MRFYGLLVWISESRRCLSQPNQLCLRCGSFVDFVVLIRFFSQNSVSGVSIFALNCAAAWMGSSLWLLLLRGLALAVGLRTAPVWYCPRVPSAFSLFLCCFGARTLIFAPSRSLGPLCSAWTLAPQLGKLSWGRGDGALAVGLHLPIVHCWKWVASSILSPFVVSYGRRANSIKAVAPWLEARLGLIFGWKCMSSWVSWSTDSLLTVPLGLVVYSGWYTAL